MSALSGAATSHPAAKTEGTWTEEQTILMAKRVMTEAAVAAREGRSISEERVDWARAILWASLSRHLPTRTRFPSRSSRP